MSDMEIGMYFPKKDDPFTASTSKHTGRITAPSEYDKEAKRERQRWLRQFETIKQVMVGWFPVLPSRDEIRWLIHVLELYSREVVVDGEDMLRASHASVEEMLGSQTEGEGQDDR